MHSTTKIAVLVAFVGVMVCVSSALQCMTGADGKGLAPLRKVDYPPVFECCYKMADMLYPRFSTFGAVPPTLSKQACFLAGNCFFTKELNKNVCVCANADDPNCQSGPLNLTLTLTTVPTLTTNPPTTLPSK